MPASITARLQGRIRYHESELVRLRQLLVGLTNLMREGGHQSDEQVAGAKAGRKRRKSGPHAARANVPRGDQHWTRKPENRARVEALVRRMRRGSRKARSKGRG